MCVCVCVCVVIQYGIKSFVLIIKIQRFYVCVLSRASLRATSLLSLLHVLKHIKLPPFPLLPFPFATLPTSRRRTQTARQSCTLRSPRRIPLSLSKPAP